MNVMRLSRPSVVLLATVFLTASAAPSGEPVRFAVEAAAPAGAADRDLAAIIGTMTPAQKAEARVRLDALDRNSLDAAQIRELAVVYRLLGESGSAPAGASDAATPGASLTRAAALALDGKRYREAARLAAQALEAEPGNREALIVLRFAEGRISAPENAAPAPVVAPAPNRYNDQAPAAAPPRRSISRSPSLSLSPSLQNADTNDPSLSRAAKHYSLHCASDDKYSCDAAQISGNCFDSSAKNICVRNCLVADDEQCVKLAAAHKPGCRVKSHLRCYVVCRKFIPNIIEASCYTKMWGSFLGNTK